MAERPIYIPVYTGTLLVDTLSVDFKWNPGMAASQKQKNVKALHEASIEKGFCNNPLEISSKSLEPLGISLSAFNLLVKTIKGDKEFTLETVFQSSKKFEHGGPFKDLLSLTSGKAKKDPRLKESGRLEYFLFKEERWELEPKTAFYDWLYLNTLKQNTKLVKKLDAFDAFTDIEFNPKKSINCQAYSVALFKSLQKRNLLDKAIKDKDSFLKTLESFSVKNANENKHAQPTLPGL